VGSTCMTCSTLLSAFGPCMIVTSRRHAEKKDHGSSHSFDLTCESVISFLFPVRCAMAPCVYCIIKGRFSDTHACVSPGLIDQE
jgi:hypothetical protein